MSDTLELTKEDIELKIEEVKETALQCVNQLTEYNDKLDEIDRRSRRIGFRYYS